MSNPPSFPPGSVVLSGTWGKAAIPISLVLAVLGGLGLATRIPDAGDAELERLRENVADLRRENREFREELRSEVRALREEIRKDGQRTHNRLVRLESLGD